jgi:hypothetical protein
MLSILLSLLILVALYIVINDSKIRLTPKEATKHSPTRWTDEDLARFMDSDPPQVDLVAGGYLGEQTGRRYIIVGGVRILLSFCYHGHSLIQLGWLFRRLDCAAPPSTRRIP